MIYLILQQILIIVISFQSYVIMRTAKSIAHFLYILFLIIKKLKTYLQILMSNILFFRQKLSKNKLLQLQFIISYWIILIMCYQNKEKNNKRQKLPPSEISRKSNYENVSNKFQDKQQIAKINQVLQQHRSAQARFKENFKLDAQKNSLVLKEFISKIDNVQNLQSIYEIKLQNSISFTSVTNYFRNAQKIKKSEYSHTDQLLQNLQEIYYFFIQSKKHEKELIICIQEYLKGIKQIMLSGHKDAKNYQFTMASSHLKKIQYNVFVILEDLLNLCKEKFNIDRQRMLIQSFSGSPNQSFVIEQQYKLRQTIQQVQKDQNILRQQNEKLLAQNNLLRKKTIPDLKEMISKKQAQEASSLKEFIEKLQMIKLKIPKEQVNKQINMHKMPLSSFDTRHSDITKEEISSIQCIYKSQIPIKETSEKQYIQLLQKNIQKELQNLYYYIYSLKDTKAKEYQHSYKKLEHQKSKLSDQNIQLVRLSEELKQQKIMMERQKYEHEESFKRRLERDREEISKLMVTVEEQTREINQLNQEILILKEKVQNAVTMTTLESKIFFNDFILKYFKSEKQYLKQRIESLIKREIEETNLLYSFRRDHKINFHQRADDHQNIVLIVQTQNALFAAFYSGVLQDKTLMIEESLIISLDNKKEYRLNNFRNYPNKDPKDQRVIKGMIYDKYYIIFGNAEIRIKVGENKVFSNFGISNSFFNHKNDKIFDLLGQEKDREVQLIDYQIYGVIFNDNEVTQLQK